MKFNMKGLVSFLTVVGGVITGLASHPELVNSMPAKIGAGLVVSAAVVSAVTDAIQKPKRRKAE